MRSKPSTRRPQRDRTEQNGLCISRLLDHRHLAVGDAKAQAGKSYERNAYTSAGYARSGRRRSWQAAIIDRKVKGGKKLAGSLNNFKVTNRVLQTCSRASPSATGTSSFFLLR